MRGALNLIVEPDRRRIAFGGILTSLVLLVPALSFVIACEHFVREPRRYYCPDGLHPSGDGYALWFATLVAQVPVAQFLAGTGSD